MGRPAVKNKEQAINIIESLWPPDDPYDDTRAIGRELLEQARAEVNGWRTEPEAVLIRLAELQLDKEWNR